MAPTSSTTTATSAPETTEAQPRPQHDDTNTFRVTGTLSTAADTRLFASGTSLTRLVVTSRSDYGHPRVDVVPITVWNARKTVQRGTRGDAVEVEGRVQRRFWTTADGARESRLELVADSVKVRRSKG